MRLMQKVTDRHCDPSVQGSHLMAPTELGVYFAMDAPHRTFFIVFEIHHLNEETMMDLK